MIQKICSCIFMAHRKKGFFGWPVVWGLAPRAEEPKNWWRSQAGIEWGGFRRRTDLQPNPWIGLRKNLQELPIFYLAIRAKTHGFPATISTFGRCPKSLWSSTWVCLTRTWGHFQKGSMRIPHSQVVHHQIVDFTKNMEMSWNMSVSHAWEPTSPVFLCSVSIPAGRQVHNGRAMRNPEMVPGRAMFPSRCEKRRGALSMALGGNRVALRNFFKESEYIARV